MVNHLSYYFFVVKKSSRRGCPQEKAVGLIGKERIEAFLLLLSLNSQNFAHSSSFQLLKSLGEHPVKLYSVLNIDR